MLKWLDALLRERDRFCMPVSQRLPPRCRIRLFRQDDCLAAEEIYRLNEPGRFPPDYFDHFAAWLRSKESLILVAEDDGRVVGLGGVHYLETKYPTGTVFAALAFGMVHPQRHRQGFGTVLLLSRLAALPRPEPDYSILITTTGGSETFYERFGFRSIGRMPAEARIDAEIFDTYRMRLYGKDWDGCRASLALGGVMLDLADAVVPSVRLPEPRSAQS